MFVSENVDSNLPKSEQTNHIYSLYGVIVHSGRSTRNGHYYSFVKKEDKWYMCNDESISEVRNIDQVLKQNAYMLVYRYNLNHTKKPQVKPVKAKTQAPVQHPTYDLSLSRAKSLSAEIMESQQKKNEGTMPLSGFFEGKENVDSDEEEEKLVQKEKMTQKEEQKFTELDYILDTFEGVDLENISELDIMKNLSTVSLRDDINTPELKSYISSTLLKRKATKEAEIKKKNNNKTVKHNGSIKLNENKKNGFKIPASQKRK